ncbi:MAG: FAD-dependent thymidylate synthase [Rivularia sp. (in: cyanobacteria)]
MDEYFQIQTISKTLRPQTTIWLAMHQDYCEESIIDEINEGHFPESEVKAGELAIKHLLAGNRGHFGCTEHPQLVVACAGFPHTVMQQVRTHRHISVDCQSGRYTGKRILDVVNDKRSVEEVFYLRPVGDYTDRTGKKYTYSENQRIRDIEYCRFQAQLYAQKISQGFSEEHARDVHTPYCIRQHFIMSGNMRTVMHLLDLRWKKDAQLECQQWAELLFSCFNEWAPQVAGWYLQNRAQKARLSP